MPQALPLIASSVAAKLGATVFVQTIVAIAASLTVAEYQKSRARRDARSAAAAAARARTVTVRSGVAPRKLALGTVRLSGPLMYAEFVGADEEYFDSIVALTHGEIAELVGVYLDDEYVAAADVVSQAPTTGKYSAGQANAERLTEVHTLSASASITLANVPSDTGTVYAVLTSGAGDGLTQTALTVSSVVGTAVTLSAPVTGDVHVSYSTMATVAGPIKLQWAMGTTSQASTTWSGVSTPKWTTDHRLQGVSYLRALMRMEDNVFATGPPNLSAVVRGPVGVYDPRIPGNVNGTSNPALLAAWLRTLPRADGGLGVPSAWIDWDSVATAANVCDELITVRKLDDSGYETVKRYECHTVLSLDQSPLQNLQVILDAMAGDFPFTAGLYRCFAGEFRAAARTITDSDVAGQAAVVFAPMMGGDQSTPNSVTATFYDAAHGWVETGARSVVNSTYITTDGAEEVMELDLQATTDERQANYLMGVRLERSRPALACSLTLAGVGADIALLDTLQFDLDGYEAIDGKTFEVRRRVNEFNGRYPVELREIRSSTYALDADRFTPAAAVTPPDNSALFRPSPVTITAITASVLEQSDGTHINRALVTWDSHPQSFVLQTGYIELRHRRPGGEWVYAPPVPGAQTQAYVGPLDDGAVVLVEARARNGLGAVSEWTGFAPFTVTGKTAAPSNVTGLAYAIKPGQVQVTWNAAPDLDYKATELRVGVSWAAGSFLWSGAGTEYQHPRPANGTYTVWAAHLDASGNYSATPASLGVTVDDSIDPGAGLDAQLLTISATGFAFVFADANATTSASPTITFTAALQNASGTVAFSAEGFNASGTSLGAVTLTGVTATTAQLTASNFVDGQGTAVRSVRVTATLGSLSDTYTVYRGDDGTSTVQAALSNEAHTLPADSGGTVTSYANSGTEIHVYEGLTELSYDGVGTAAGRWKVTTSASNITRGSLTDSGTYLTVGNHSAMTADQASITYTIDGKTNTGAAFTLTKVQTFAKSKAGADGADGTSGTDGARGSLIGNAYGQYGISDSSWSDGHANRTINNMLTGASLTTTLATTSHLRIGDMVTESNGTSFSEQRFWSGSAWLVPGVVISGNAIVGGTISGGANLNITGFAKIEGSNSYTLNIFGSSTAVTAAVVSNTSGSSEYGLVGYSTTASRAGVYGYNSSASNSAGVAGYSPNVGVSGGGAVGVQGTGAINGNSIGVYGLGPVSSGTGAGVKASNALNTANWALQSDGKAQFTAQIHSTVATGTAPFVVASTTEVANLNVASLKGKNWAAPDPIGSTTPNTGAFTTLSSTGLATVSSLRINQGSSSGTAQWNLPNGGSTASGKPGANSTGVFVPVNMNGTSGWMLWWPN